MNPPRTALLSRPRERLRAAGSGGSPEDVPDGKKGRVVNVIVYRADQTRVKAAGPQFRTAAARSVSRRAARQDRFGPPRHASVPAMTADSPPSFEAALAELEALVATMESGQLPLKESLAAYERGARLLSYCQDALKDAQQQVEVLEKGVLKSFRPEADDDA